MEGEILIPHAFAVVGVIEDDTTGQSAFRMVPLRLYMQPASVGKVMTQIGFALPYRHIRSLTLFAGGESAITEGEGIAAVGTQESTVEG